MLSLEHSGTRLCDGVSRREWLRCGGLGALGLSLPQFLAARSQADSARTATAKRCLQIYLWGGPGAQETWDLKPAAPEVNRGEFRPISTAIPGVQYCEHLPELSRRADRFSIIRSLTHTGVNHGTSSYHMLTGHIHKSPGTLRHPEPDDMPNLGANAARFLRHPAYLPAHVHLPAIVNDGDGLPVPGQGPGILGEAHQPFCVLGDLTRGDFKVPALQLQSGVSRPRLRGRLSLAEVIEGQAPHLRGQATRRLQQSYEQAIGLLSSPKTDDAFDLSRESVAVRQRYGMHHFAQALLLGRRLLEAGVPFVTVYWTTPRNTDNESWDTHTNQHVRMREHLLPAFDRALSAFLDEMQERGMLDETLVTWYGEFGRTPVINRSGGRDHWGFCQSIGLAGGGVKPGLVYGSSTKDGGYAETQPVSPDDLAATIYHCLGIDHHTLMYDLQQRPLPLSYGVPVTDILI